MKEKKWWIGIGLSVGVAIATWAPGAVLATVVGAWVAVKLSTLALGAGSGSFPVLLGSAIGAYLAWPLGEVGFAHAGAFGLLLALATAFALGATIAVVLGYIGYMAKEIARK